MANRERNMKMHAERGNIEMVVANVTVPQRHWPILAKHKADWLALTEVRVRQRDIPVVRAQFLNSGYDSKWEKLVESANECGGVSFGCSTPGFAAVVLDEDLPVQYRRAHRRSRSMSPRTSRPAAGEGEEE